MKLTKKSIAESMYHAIAAILIFEHFYIQVGCDEAEKRSASRKWRT